MAGMDEVCLYRAAEAALCTITAQSASACSYAIEAPAGVIHTANITDCVMELDNAAACE